MSETNWIDAERARCRRPIRTTEVPPLESLASELRRMRWDIGRISRPELSRVADVSVRQIEQIERAIRRTRRSTIERIAAALSQLNPKVGAPEVLVERLVALAGDGLAPESPFRHRVDRRRRRRWRKKGR